MENLKQDNPLRDTLVYNKLIYYYQNSRFIEIT